MPSSFDVAPRVNSKEGASFNLSTAFALTACRVMLSGMGARNSEWQTKGTRQPPLQLRPGANSQQLANRQLPGLQPSTQT